MSMDTKNTAATRLIETAGLKGHALGDAVVSEKHANFISSQSDASAADIEGLIQHVQKVVLEKHGIQLIPEVHIIGEQASAEGKN